MIVYYLGAGASCGAIPMVNRFFRWKNFDLYSELSRYAANQVNPEDRRKECDRISRLILLSQQDWSVDTFANNLFYHSESDYQDFKCILSAYLYAIESTPKTDTRYQHLFSALRHRLNQNKQPVFFRNFGFISWNYDVQIEKAIAKLSRQVNIQEATKSVLLNEFQIFDLRRSYFRIPVIRMNGSIAGNNSYGSEELTFPILNSNDSLIDVFWDRYSNLRDEYLNLKKEPIRFSWDSKSVLKESIYSAQQLLEEAQHIVVIGYSFPYFNSLVDRKIFTKIRVGTRIYVQCTDASNTGVIKRIEDILGDSAAEKKISIVPIYDSSQFYQPPMSESDYLKWWSE